MLHADRLVRTQEDVRTLERLPDLILDDLRISTEHGSEGVRMEDDAPGYVNTSSRRPWICADR